MVARVLRYLLVVSYELAPILNQNRNLNLNRTIKAIHNSQLSTFNSQLSTD